VVDRLGFRHSIQVVEMATDTINIEPGKRITAQRQMLLEILREADGHLDADELYQRARHKQPSLSLSTVYRSLKLFKELGLVEEHQFDGARRHYEPKQGGHHHLVCLGCGRIIEFRCPTTERLKAKIGREEGFEVTEAEVRLAGYCPKCRQRLAESGAAAESKQKTGDRR
jgi:Fur family ferric uptake transcriptional regulator